MIFEFPFSRLLPIGVLWIVLIGWQVTDAHAQTAADSLDQIMDGFGDDSAVATNELEPQVEDVSQHPLSVGGFLKFSTSANVSHEAPNPGETDWRGLSKLRGELLLEMKVKPVDRFRIFISGKGFYDSIYTLSGREDYTDQILDEYETELELREAYIQARVFDQLDLKLGRQIVVWGKSDNIRITDILNPLDLREPGLTDIEDLRLPVGMSRMDYYFGNWDLSAMVIPEIRFNKTPAFGHDFFPSPSPLPPEEKPSSGFEDAEIAFSLSGIFSGWDIAFYYAYLFDDFPYFAHAANATGGALKHARLNMVGLAYNRAVGNFLLKGEVAGTEGFRFFNTPEDTYTRIDGLIGVEYSGFSETVVSFEIADRHWIDFDDKLALPPDEASVDELQTALRISRDFYNDTLTLTFLAVSYGLTGQNGAFERISATYDWSDNIELNGGVVFYQSGDLAEFREIGDNDRVFFEVLYHF